MSGARNQCDSRWQAELCCPSKCLLTFNGLHGVISQKVVILFKTGGVPKLRRIALFLP
jgi:hypothetical protein